MAWAAPRCLDWVRVPLNLFRTGSVVYGAGGEECSSDSSAWGMEGGRGGRVKSDTWSEYRSILD